jgi:hypothetical protein
MGGGEGDGGELAKKRQEELAVYRQGQDANAKKAAALQASMGGRESALKDQMIARQRQFDQQLKANKDAALGAFEAQRQGLQAAAKQSMASPVSAPNMVGSMAPLEAVTGVSLDAAMAGRNAASQAFYLNPQSTQSQFAVGAPVGGGGIGQRTSASTPGITSRSDTLGNKRKDQF